MGFRDSQVEGGWLAGNAISDVMDMYMDRLVGDSVFSIYGRQFPLMVKWLEVKGRTPLMVHPGDEDAEGRYDTLGKTKLWYIVDAEPGSKLYIGMKRDTDATDFYTRCLDGTVLDLVNEVKPKKGDSILITPGLVHAAEGGLIIAEVSESSDLDFKLCNWGKPTENDTDESLTIVEAMDFIDYTRTIPSILIHDRNAELIADCPQFVVTRLKLSAPLRINTSPSDSFVIYMCIEGEASIQVPEDDEMGNPKTEEYRLGEGETILIPADVQEYIVAPLKSHTKLLESMVRLDKFDDPYIDKSVEARLPDDEEFDFLSPDADETDED